MPTMALIAVWFGTVAGLLEVAVLTFQKFVRHGLTHRGAQVVWMAPLAEVIVLLVAGLVLLGIGLAWRRARSLPVIVAAFAFLAMLSLVLLPGWLAWWAATLLAAGVAAQAALISRRYPVGFERLLRRTVAIPVLMTIALALVVNVQLETSERRALAHLTEARPNAANVIVIVWDAVRARSLSLYGNSRPTTPNLERLAEQGVVYDRAIATSPWTLPSHASMFTGLFRHQLDVGWALPFRQGAPTLAEVLDGAGYRTGGFVGNLLYTDAEHGLARGFAHYEDRPVSLGEVLWNSPLLRTLADDENGLTLKGLGPHRYLWHKSAGTINRDFLRWVAQDSARPFFAFLNYFDAHDPYLPPPEFRNRFGNIERPGLAARLGKLARGESVRDPAQHEVDRELQAYESTIAYLDHSLGELAAALERRGLLQNTVMVLTSDHGEEFGEHGGFRHGENLYMTALHVPLVVLAPGRVQGGQRVTAPVSLRDLSASILALIGMEGSRLPGVSWPALVSGTPNPSPTPVLSATSRALYGQNLQHSLVTEQYHYFLDESVEHLYDLSSDPAERTNLSQPDFAPLLTMRAFIDSIRGSTPRGGDGGGR